MSYLPTETTVDSMLASGKKQYIVPIYQREYSWGEYENNDFWEDLEFAIKNEDRHFIGTIVLHKKSKDDDKANIIDGQQRLATISIIISCLKQVAKERSITTVDDFYLKSLLLTPADVPEQRIILSEKDKDIFAKYIKDNCSDPSNHLIVKAKQYYTDKIKALLDNAQNANEEAVKILSTIAKRLDIIQIIVETDEEGYSIFESINSTGKELSISDLVKNHVFGVSESKGCLPEVRKLWEEIIDEVTEKQFVNFLKHYYISKKGNTTEKRTFKDLKKYHLNDFNEDILEFMKDLKNEAFYYSFLVFTDSAKIAGDYDTEIIDHLNGINSMGVTQCYPLMMSLLAETEKRTIKPLLELIKKYLFRFTSCGLNPNVFTEIFIEKASKIRNGNTSDEVNEFKKSIMKHNPSDDDFIKSFKKLFISKRKLQRYVLSELENSLSRTTDEKTISPSITIEHILPKNPDNSWKTVYDIDNNEHKEYINRVGNLTLLSMKLNPKIGNKSFEEKVNDAEGYSQSEIKLTEQLVKTYYPDHVKWDKEAINKRQENLSSIAKDIWKI